MTWLDKIGLNRNRTHLARDHARAGAAPHVVRHVLTFSIALALTALAVALLFGKPPVHDSAAGRATAPAAASGQAQ